MSTFRHFLCLLTYIRMPSMSTNITNSSSTVQTVGWVNSPDGRGTLDIIWSCLLTTVLCTWTTLHLNVPAQHDRYRERFLLRLRWTLIAYVAPEVIVGFAAGQRAEARRSVEAFRRAGFPFWTTRHAFYANMGGFLLASSDNKTFPVNSTQLLYLIRNGYIPYPTATDMEIAQKGKEDNIQRLLTFVQLSWFVIQIMSRAILRLPITTLEVATLGLVFCSGFTFSLWSSKPLSPEDTIIISSPTRMTDILVEAGPDARLPYRQTPLDFIDYQSRSWLREVQPHLRFRLGPPERPLPRLTNDNFPVFGTSFEASTFFFAIIGYACLHLIAWKFHFPTQEERKIWRVLCIVMVASAIVFLVFEVYRDGHRTGRWRRWCLALFPKAPFSPHQGSVADTPLWHYALRVVLATLFTASRIYIVVECFSSLRALPRGAYESIEWTNILPHF